MTPEELSPKGMTRTSLDERILMDITPAIYDDQKEYSEAIKQLIRDCIEAVTPRTQPGEGRQALLHTREWYDGYNQAIDTIEQNTKELLG